MKNLLALFIVMAGLFFAAADASAQYASVYRKGTSLYTPERVKLTQDQMNELFGSLDGYTYADWQKASRGFNAGKGLLIGFGVLTGTGIVTLGIGAVGLMMEGVAVGLGTMFVAPVAAATGEPVDIGYKSKFQGVAAAGVCMVGGGLLCMVAGTTVYCIYKKQLNDMTAACNARPRELSLSFGMKEHGIGFALNF